MLNCKKNASRATNSRSAFTLIELMIVITIISFLVAGITGGAKLIQNAKRTAAIAEFTEYRTSVAGFVDLVGYNPGDVLSDVATTFELTNVGNGDGTIDAGGTEGQEALAAIKQLHTLGFDGGFEITANPAAATVQPAIALSTDMPRSKIDTAGWMFGNLGTGKNAIALTGSTSEAASDDTLDDIVDGAAGVTGYDALYIDRKLDDGNTGTGMVTGGAAASSALDSVIIFQIDGSAAVTAPPAGNP